MRARPLVSSLLALLAAGCAPPQTALVNLWINADYAGEAPKHVMVVALWQDRNARALWEQRFAQVLAEKHIDATPSYLESPVPMPDSATVFHVAGNRRCDGVLVIHERVMYRNSYYIPGLTQPQKPKTPRWFRATPGTEVWAGDSAGAAGFNRPSCDVELWVPGGRAAMVWSGTGEVAYPGSDNDAACSVAGTVVSELSRLGLVPSPL